MLPQYTGTSAFMTAYAGILPPAGPGGTSSSSQPSSATASPLAQQHPAPFDRGAFPSVAISDDVRAQHRLVTEHFGISQLAMVAAVMGGQQTRSGPSATPTPWPDRPVRGHVPEPGSRTVFCDLHTSAAQRPRLPRRLLRPVDGRPRRPAPARPGVRADGPHLRDVPGRGRELGFTSRDGFVRASAGLLPAHGPEQTAHPGRQGAPPTSRPTPAATWTPPSPDHREPTWSPTATCSSAGGHQGRRRPRPRREVRRDRHLLGSLHHVQPAQQDTAAIDAIYAEALAS